MPFVSIAGSVSPLDMCYVISTPTCSSASAIVTHLPTIIFLHSGYIAKHAFEPQFCDPQLRRFNLVAVDLRAYGETKGVIGEGVYRPTETAEDIFQFMKALNLPPCHFFGLSIGASVAMALASSHSDRVISLTLCSPLTPSESEDVKDGRLQIYEYWTQGVSANSHRTVVDADFLEELVVGVTQLLFNNQSNPLINAIMSAGVVQALEIWAGTEEKIKESYKSAISWFVERTPLTLDQFAKMKDIKAVSIIHCADDLAYPIDNCEELAEQFQQIGIENVILHEVPGPHYGNITSATLINPILRDTVLSCQGSNTPLSTLTDVDPCQKMETPFTDLLGRYGYDPFDESDSELFV